MDKKLALAEYLGIDESEVEEIDTDEFETPEGDYRVFTDEEADEEFRAYEESIFDDLGLESFSQKFQDWILDNAIDEEAVNDFIDNEIEYFRNEEEDEDLLNYLLSLETTDDKISYIKELYGDMEGFSDWAKDHIDLDAVFEEIKDSDGRGILADWDGEELELPNDFYAYRVN